MCNLDDGDGDYLRQYTARVAAPWARACDDCGRTIAKGETHEVVVWSEWRTVEAIGWDLSEPFGDIRRRAAETRRVGVRTRPFTGGRFHVLVEFTRGTEETTYACLQCLAAGRWLDDVCSGYLYGTACQQLAEHWDEDPIYRCRDLGRLVLYSGARFDLCDGGWGHPSTQSCYHDRGPVVSRTRRQPWTDAQGRLIAPAVIDHWVDRALAVYHRHDPVEAAA